MAGKSGLLAVLLIALVLAPSLVFARDLDARNKAAASFDGAPMLQAVLGEALRDACNWCVVGHSYCCGQLTHCCGRFCCLRPCVGNSCG